MKKTVLVIVALLASAASAWWDHPYITRVAWDAQPKELTAGCSDFERDELCYHAMMSDYPRMKTAGDFGYFQLWDAFMWYARRSQTDYANGGGQDDDYARVLQAMRTETTLNAFLWSGSLFHMLEDSMSISHVSLSGPYQAGWHALCESFADWEKFSIGDYVAKPIPFGDDPAALRRAVNRRVEEVKAKAKELWPDMQAIIDEHGVQQKGATKAATNERLDPYVRAFADGVAKLTADVLCTLLTARREALANRGAALEGMVSVPREDRVNARRSAKVYLRTADGRPTVYETLAIGGRYAFRNLPAGTYRLYATRLGCARAETSVFSLTTGAVARADITLRTELPLGNQVWNPCGTWDLYDAGSPDRWRVKPLFNWGPLQQKYWRTSFMHVESGWTYRCGAKVKKSVEVRFRFAEGFGGHGPAITLPLTNGVLEAETTWTNTNGFYKAKVEVVSTEPVSDLIERAWFVPVPPKGWDGVYPQTDYVPCDNPFRQAIGILPPKPEFWQRDMRRCE